LDVEEESMRGTTFLQSGAIAVVVAAGCANLSDDTSTARIAVAEENDLGVVALDVERQQDDGNSVFELRGIGTHDEELALVRLTIGSIPEAAEQLRSVPGDLGSEILLVVGDARVRWLTREVQEFRIPPVDSAAMRAFLDLGAVSSALSSHANMRTQLTDSGNDVGEQPSTTMACPPSYMNTSPTAKQCCYDTYRYTTIITPANMFGFRQRNASGAACRSSSNGSCSGSACYYGPNAFSSPALTDGLCWDGSANCIYKKVASAWSAQYPDPYCAGARYGTPQTPSFADVTGTFTTGRGCCINGSGPCGPGLIACSSCGGGGSAGQGFWDY
jgi:hypothetical protein